MVQLGGLTYISQFALNFEAKAPFRTIRQNYRAVITEATFFFASPALEQEFVSANFTLLTLKMMKRGCDVQQHSI